MIGRVLVLLLALVLVAILAVLYLLSQGGDLKHQTQIVADLRNLREIDTSWNRHGSCCGRGPRRSMMKRSRVAGACGYAVR